MGLTCRPCRFVSALTVNILFALDICANVLLLGRPPETISVRLARLRESGNRAAWVGRIACAALGWCAARITGSKRDHCTWTLAADGTAGTELWPWS